MRPPMPHPGSARAGPGCRRAAARTPGAHSRRAMVDTTDRVPPAAAARMQGQDPGSGSASPGRRAGAETADKAGSPRTPAGRPAAAPDPGSPRGDAARRRSRPQRPPRARPPSGENRRRTRPVLRSGSSASPPGLPGPHPTAGIRLPHRAARDRAARTSGRIPAARRERGSRRGTGPLRAPWRGACVALR